MMKYNSLSILAFIGLLTASYGCEDVDDTLDFDDSDKGTRASDLCSKPAGSTGNCDPYEAEKRTSQSGTSIASNHAGYTGSGFVDYGGNGTWIEWNNIAAPEAGEYTFTFRYANGSSGDRQAAVSVKGGASKNVPFASTGSWKTWRTVSTKLTLKEGNNTIVVKANTGAGGPNLDNMLVVGEKQDVVEGSNIALGKSASQSSLAYGGDPARAVDGNTSGRYGDGSITHTADTSAPWWRVELGGAYRVDKVTLYNRTDCCSDRLSNFDVTLLGQNDSVLGTSYHAGQAQTKTDINISASGVYAVRVQLRGTNPLSLAEVQVFGAKDTGGNSRCTTANERLTARLSCPSGETINNISFASYGLPTGSCNPGFEIGTCHAASSKSKVSAACLNKQSCSISASNGTFGDPCAGTFKRLSVAYTCSGGGIQDQCPSDPNKTAPGVCGCGTPDTDSDGDNTPDCQDNCPSDRDKTNPGQCGCGVPEGTCNPTGKITHIGTTEIWDGDGQSINIAKPGGTRAGDLMILALHRTDDDLPLYVNGWTRVAECYKRDNGYDCSTEDDCTSWHNDNFCGSFGGHGGHDLAQSIFFKKAGSNEPSSYRFNLNIDSSGHPGWIILTTLRGADTNNPVRDWSYKGCDGNAASVFPSVYGQKGDMVLLSQSFDDKIAQSKFGAPTGTSSFGYVSNSDEAGFLFGGILNSTGQTGTMKTQGEGGPSCKDALVSLTIKPQ